MSDGRRRDADFAHNRAELGEAGPGREPCIHAQLRSCLARNEGCRLPGTQQRARDDDCRRSPIRREPRTEACSLRLAFGGQGPQLVRLTGSGLSVAAEEDEHEREDTDGRPDNGSLTTP